MNWRTSSHSDSQNCAEAGHGAGRVLVRDTKDAQGPVLAVPAAAWTAFTAGLKDSPGRS